MKHLHTLLLSSLLSTSALATEPSPAPAESATSTEPASTSTEPEARRTIIGIPVFSLSWSALTLEGERVVSPRLSVGLGVRAGILHSRSKSESSFPVIPSEQDRTEYTLGASPMVRFFLTGAAPEGLWLSPTLEFTRSWGSGKGDSSLVDNTSESQRWLMGGSMLVGYSTVVGRGLAVQAGVGIGARYDDYRIKTRNIPPPDSGFEASESESRSRSWDVGERVALSVGWAF